MVWVIIQETLTRYNKIFIPMKHTSKCIKRIQNVNINCYHRFLSLKALLQQQSLVSILLGKTLWSLHIVIRIEKKITSRLQHK